MLLNANDHEANELIKYMREASGKTQTEFAKDVGKQKGWTVKAERGEIRIYFNDFLKLAKENNLKVTITDKQKD